MNFTMKKPSTSTSETPDWKKVVIEIVLKIITLGLYHVEKNRKK